MSKVVFFGFPGHGHINPTLGVVRELIARGEEVIYFCNPWGYQAKIKDAGADFRSYKIPLFRKNQLEKRLNPNTLNQSGKEAFHRMNIYFDVIANKRQDLKKLLTQIKPDYVIHDSCAGWGKTLAKQLGIPAICSVTTFAYCDRVLETHPDFVIYTILRMPEGSLTNLNDAPKIIGRLAQMLGKLFGIPDYDFFDLAYSEESLNIVFTSKEFQFFGELFDERRFKFVGPSLKFRTESAKAKVFPLQPTATGQPTATKKPTAASAPTGEKSLIYISLGTVDNRNPAYPEFYRKCFAAFGDSGRQVVLAIGNASRSKLGKIPPNFVVRRTVPQLEILKQAALFITHGGMNSASEAIYFNVPMIVIPQRVDQFQVARRVAEVGAGIAMKNLEFTPGELSAAASEILTNESYRQSCQIIAESLQGAGGAKQAVDEIFQFKTERGIK